MPQPPAMSLHLQPGQTQRVLVEADSAVYVCQGRLQLNGPLVWLDGQLLSRPQLLDSETLWPVADGGWLDLFAEHGAQVLVLPPPQASGWRVGLLRSLRLPPAPAGQRGSSNAPWRPRPRE